MAKLLPGYPEFEAQLAAAMGAPRWYVALSGGLDSTVLLALLQDWCRRHPLAPPLAAIHVNHGLQDGAGDWQRHCEDLCRQLQLPLHCESVTVQPAGRGIESAARDARYEVFRRCLQPGDLLFMGHHLDDQVETFFLRLLRGAGVRGLAAIPAARPLGRGQLLRPLLAVPRAELEACARRLGLAWVNDPSNADAGLDRNYLRHQVLPLLAARWPGYRRTVGRAATHLAASVAGSEGDYSPDHCCSVLGDPGIRLRELRAIAPGQLMEAIRSWLRGRGLPMPALAPLREFTRQLQAGGSGSPRLEWGGHAVQQYRDAVYLLPEPLVFSPPLRPPRLAPGSRVTVPGLGQFELVPAVASGLRLAPGESLQLRWRRGGERCRPLPGGASRSLKKLLQEAAVPPWWRLRLPLLYHGDELLAVADLWLCESSRRWRPGAGGGEGWTLRWLRNNSSGPGARQAAFD